MGGVHGWRAWVACMGWHVCLTLTTMLSASLSQMSPCSACTKKNKSPHHLWIDAGYAACRKESTKPAYRCVIYSRRSVGRSYRKPTCFCIFRISFSSSGVARLARAIKAACKEAMSGDGS